MPKEEYVWVRLGNIAEYKKYYTPYEAGEEVKSVIKSIYPSYEPKIYTYIQEGVEITPFYTRQNYVFLFWGDYNAQYSRDLTSEEKESFRRGFEKTKFVAPKTKRIEIEPRTAKMPIFKLRETAERCKIARDITKDVLRGECGSEYPKSFEDVIKERVMTCPVCGYKIPAHLPLSKMEEHMLEKHPEWFESH